MSCLHLPILGSGSKGNAHSSRAAGARMVDDGLSRRGDILKRAAELGFPDNVFLLFSLP